MSALEQAVADYLAARRALGFKLQRHGRLLPQLVAYLQQAGASTLTTPLALAWATSREGHPDLWAVRLSVARGFARWLAALDPATEIPPADLLRRRRHRARPYLYTEAEIATLMTTTDMLRHPLRAATYRTLIGLLAVTGMRVGEAIGLDRHDLDWTAGCLIVREGKPGACRELPLHESTLDALAEYAHLRDRHWPHPKAPAFFVSTVGKRLLYENINWTFRRLLRQAGLPAPGSPRPRIHDLRHGFAVNTVTDWYRAGVNVAARMPHLSAYLGHADPGGTYWYLTATPELLALAAARLESRGRWQP